jgi:hypothetical protein
MHTPATLESSPLNRCMQTLGVLIKEGDVNGIALAERAINEFLQRQPNLDQRTGHLHILEQEIDRVWKVSRGASLDFVNLIGDYLRAKHRELQPDQ